MKLKYVVYDECYPVIFGEYANHSDVSLKYKKPTSAGFVSLHEEDAPEGSPFCQVRILTASCYGESISLGVKSHPNDARLIERLFNV